MQNIEHPTGGQFISEFGAAKALLSLPSGSCRTELRTAATTVAGSRMLPPLCLSRARDEEVLKVESAKVLKLWRQRGRQGLLSEVAAGELAAGSGLEIAFERLRFFLCLERKKSLKRPRP